MTMYFRNSSRRQRNRGFTLMEILVVLAILGLLAGLAVSKLGGIFDGAKIDTAKSFVTQSIKVPLFSYKMHMGDFPSTQEGLNALITPPASRGGWRGPYLEPAKIPEDPWNTPYNYTFPGTRNRDSYDVWSSGPDKQSGTEDDIGNWEVGAQRTQ